jgi:hypothetical protein
LTLHSNGCVPRWRLCAGRLCKDGRSLGVTRIIEPLPSRAAGCSGRSEVFKERPEDQPQVGEMSFGIGQYICVPHANVCGACNKHQLFLTKASRSTTTIPRAASVRLELCRSRARGFPFLLWQQLLLTCNRFSFPVGRCLMH